MNLLFENCSVVPMTGIGERCFEGAVGVQGQRITLVSCAAEGEAHTRRVENFVKECAGDLRRIDARGMALMPGLVNAHNHAAMSLMRGFADDIPLIKWLNEYIWPFEAGLDAEAIRTGMELAVAEMLAGGTTTFADMYWMESEAAAVVDKAGIRAMLAPTFMDDNFDKFQDDLEGLLGRWAGKGDERVGAMIAPHAPYTCSPEYLRRAVELADRYDLILYTHVSETRDEVADMRRRYNCTSAEYLRDAGFFTRPAVAVHGVYLNETDMDLLARYGVPVVHNPESNMKLASGVAPVKRMLEKGLTVCLGTDGPCSNNDLDMWEEMRSASFMQKVATVDPLVLPAWEMLYMATAAGAKALRLDDRIGTVAEGMLADVILIDTRKPHMQPCHDLVSNLAYCAKASDVAMTVVDGRIVAEGGRCTTLDVRDVMRHAQEYIESIDVLKDASAVPRTRLPAA
ncbi:MAG: amidohydrolase [Rikenellaceae bacterium]|jgi:5-methylthioadenosine/S-adenosylhomocysteine deaminase|nr:amidohydrolase [Rikenellaceae bacterium]